MSTDISRTGLLLTYIRVVRRLPIWKLRQLNRGRGYRVSRDVSCSLPHINIYTAAPAFLVPRTAAYRAFAASASSASAAVDTCWRTASVWPRARRRLWALRGFYNWSTLQDIFLAVINTTAVTIPTFYGHYFESYFCFYFCFSGQLMWWLRHHRHNRA